MRSILIISACLSASTSPTAAHRKIPRARTNREEAEIAGNPKLAEAEIAGNPKLAEAHHARRDRPDPASHAHHARRISPFLRYAGYDCQKKGAMLQAFERPTVLEIGSHDGSEWDSLFEYAQHVWAVEPSPDKQSNLRQRMQDLKAKGHSMDLYQLAITNASGEVKFWVDGKDSQQNTAGKPPPWIKQQQFDKEAITVGSSSLDDLWKSKLERAHITMVKVDCQGHEPNILMSGVELFKMDPPDIVHLEYSPALMEQAGLDGVSMLDYLYDVGYLCFDCEAFGPPPVDPDTRSFEGYTAHFANWTFKGANHGQWTDMVCLM